MKNRLRRPYSPYDSGFVRFVAFAVVAAAGSVFVVLQDVPFVDPFAADEPHIFADLHAFVRSKDFLVLRTGHVQ